MKQKRTKKRLSVELSDQLHREVKTRASFRGIPMREWIEIAIAERIKEEQKYE